MLTRYAASLLRLYTVLALVFPALPDHVAAAPPRQGMRSLLMVYHELTVRPEGSRGIDTPILSGDGRRAIWAESPGDPNPREENRVFALDLDGGQPAEIDAYQPICACRARVDISDDGNTVVSTDGVRIRILSGAATFGRAHEVLRLANNAIGALRISGDGTRIVFVVIRDTTVSEPNPRKLGTPIPRGVWALGADGTAPIHLAGVEEIAVASGVPKAALEADPDFTSDGAINALAVSDDGGHVIFGAHVGVGGEAVFSLTADAPLSKLYGPVQSVGQTAVSGDGQTVAFMTETQANARVMVISGGTLRSTLFGYMDRGERLQLSRDGSTLLGKGLNGAVLVDVATSATRQLFSTMPPSPLAAGASSRLLKGPGGSPTMNAAGTRVLYIADPLASNHGNLAVIELGPADLSGAPLIRELHADPDTVPPDGSKSASVTADVSWGGALIGVWLEILRDGVPETAFGPSVVPMEREAGPDPQALQGVFAATLQSRDMGHALGPRQLRVLSESQATDGRRHGTVLETDETVTVGDAGLRTFQTDQAQPSLAAWVVPYWWESLPAWQAEWEMHRFHAEIRLDSSSRVSGGSLTIEMVNPAAQARDYLEDYHITFEGTAGEGSSITPWTDVSFVGTRQAEQQGGGERRDDSYAVTLMIALNDTGQLVMCDQQAHVGVDTPEQARQNCIAQALATLQPVESSPPPPLA